MSERERMLLDLLARAVAVMEESYGDEADVSDGGCPCDLCKRGKEVLRDIYEVVLEDES